MSSYGLQGGFRDFVVFSRDIGVKMESVLTVFLFFLFFFCYVVFSFTDNIPSCLHVHGNFPKCYLPSAGGPYFFIMHEKSHFGSNRTNITTMQNRKRWNIHWDNCLVGFFFLVKKNSGFCSNVWDVFSLFHVFITL